MKTRTFLITGASKGIGRALANQLSQAGQHVVGIARNGNDPDFPGTLVALDLGDREQTEKTLAGLVSRYAFDGLINNVGLVRPQALGDVQLDDFDEVMRINLHSALQATQALLPGMRNRGWGRIVNISSLTILGIPHRTAYAAAKAALVSFTRSWALELATSGITVNAVAQALRKPNCSAPGIRSAATVKHVTWRAFPWAGSVSRMKSRRPSPSCYRNRAALSLARHCLSMAERPLANRRSNDNACGRS